MAILVGPVAGDADGPIPVEVGTDADDGLDQVYGDEETRDGPSGRVVRVARAVYADGLDLARRCAVQAVRRFGELPESERPDEIELQLSIRMDAGLATVVKSGAEAQLQFTFRWQPGRTGSDGAGPGTAR
ncbi:CU044_2847 family protein [Streptomyces maremycinicus]|uniref:CU044_2847 family protein n=1 Tax=Streptomyces maremycinicus TaxID=1679753 RepID=UPI000AB39AA8|nr:CU044_2847 family protein [Streptomyces sp. NBRC 110468]